MVTMRLRKPYTTASIWSSGKVTCTGATSEDEAKQAARRITRSVSKLGYPKLRLVNYRVVNVLGTCTMPFAIKITPFSAKHRDIARYINIWLLTFMFYPYDDMYHVGLIQLWTWTASWSYLSSQGTQGHTKNLLNRQHYGYRLGLDLAAFKSVTFLYMLLIVFVFLISAPCVGKVQSAIEHIYPLVFEFRKERSPEDIRTMQATKRSRGFKRKCSSDFGFEADEECITIDDDEEEEAEDFDSDQSHDWNSPT